jgi:PST family polysaccharide transporter
MKIDKVIMPWLTSAYVLGIYSAATRLSELWYFLPFAMSTALSPLIAEAKSKNAETYDKRIRKSLIIINIATLSIALFTFIIAPIAINIYAGEKFVSALAALRIHIWSLPFISMGLIVDIWLLNEHLQKVQVMRTFVTAGVNILLNILLVPKYGALGAAWATLIAYMYPGFFANLLDKRTRAIFWIEVQSILPTPKNLKLIFEK